MAEMDWTRQAPATRRESLPVMWLHRVTGGLIDWETVVTLVLLLGAVTAVTVPLEGGGWRRDMPALTTVSVIAVVSGMLLARSRMSAFIAWPSSILIGAAVVFWQALVMVGPGTLNQRLDAIYYRFDAWFSVVSSDQVTNDPLPFNILILSLTWLGVLLFTWSVFRWHNAWIGLIPGGVALFLDLTLVGDNLTGGIVLYMLFGFLLVMQTNLLAMVRRWRESAADYPSMINLTFLNFSFWALVVLLFGAWLMPAGLTTPGPVQAAVEESLDFGARFVRLAGPLQSSKVIPIHSYSGVLPFQGSIKLGDRELMTVTVADSRIHGTLLLRGTVYDQYQGGGWAIDETAQVGATLPGGRETAISNLLGNEEHADDGVLIPLHVEAEAKSVVHTVIYTPGLPVSVSRGLTVEVPEDSLEQRDVSLRNGGIELNDQQVLAAAQAQLEADELAVTVVRDAYNTVDYVGVARLNEFGLIEDSMSLDPGQRILRHRSYFVTGFIPNYTAEDLRAASTNYPKWVAERYLQTPANLPPKVHDEAVKWTELKNATNPYDQAKAIEEQLRVLYTVDPSRVSEAPAGVDGVYHFLFEDECKCGYFDYHASAMIVMLRTLGIPARLAVGFAVDDNDRNIATGSYEVRDNDSFAWPEVYFPDYGWIAFNPTPNRSADVKPTVNEFSDPNADPLLEALRNVPAGISDFVPPEDTGVVPGAEPVGPTAVSPIGEGKSYSPVVTLAVIAFIAALGGAVVMGWQRSVAGMPYSQQVWEKTVRLASWGGFPPEPGQTPHDYATRLRKRFRGVREFPALADAYTRSRYGHKEPGDDEAKELREAWPDVRGALIGGIFGRVFRRNRREQTD